MTHDNIFPLEVYITFFLSVFICFIYQKFSTYKQHLDEKGEIVAYVKEIRVHPVKSCKPLQLQEIEVTNLGFKHDRYVYYTPVSVPR